MFKHSDDELRIAVKESFSFRAVITYLKLNNAGGGNYASTKRRIKEMGLDTSHFKFNAVMNKMSGRAETPVESYLVLNDVDNVTVTTHHLKQKLIKAGLKTAKCERCGIEEWQGSPAPIELHHINGKRYDNRLENLKILCANCHSICHREEKFKLKKSTSKIISKKKVLSKSIKKVYNCITCGIQISYNTKNNLCYKCYNISKRIAIRPSREILLEEIRVLGYSGTGRKYGVTDNAIRKWLK